MIVEEIKGILADKLGIDVKEIKDDSTITGELKVDSLDMVEILMSIEDRYGLKIPDEATAGFHKVSDIADYVSSKKAA